MQQGGRTMQPSASPQPERRQITRVSTTSVPLATRVPIGRGSSLVVNLGPMRNLLPLLLVACASSPTPAPAPAPAAAAPVAAPVPPPPAAPTLRLSTDVIPKRYAL